MLNMQVLITGHLIPIVHLERIVRRIIHFVNNIISKHRIYTVREIQHMD